MAASSKQRTKRVESKTLHNYAVAKEVLDACSRVQEDLNSYSRNGATQFLKDERFFQGKLAEKLDSHCLDYDFQCWDSDCQCLHVELEYRPSSAIDKRLVRIDALVENRNRGKVLVEIKKQRMTTKYGNKYNPTSVQDQLLRLVVQTQLEGGLGMFIWIGDREDIGSFDYFLDRICVPACRRIHTETNDIETIHEEVRMRLGLQYQELADISMRFTGIRIDRMAIGTEIQHQRLYIRVWIIDPKYRDVGCQPDWITPTTEAGDIRFSMDTRESRDRGYRTDVRITYQKQRKSDTKNRNNKKRVQVNPEDGTFISK